MAYKALVTGGNRGIGKAVVAGLTSQGYGVLLGCRDLGSAQRAAKEIPGDVTPVLLDLSNRKEMDEALGRLLKEHGDIDVLINNAGILCEGGLFQIDADQLYESMQINFLSAFELIKRLAPGMIKRGYGRIVNVSSGWGSFREGLGGPLAYSSSKAALNSLTMISARELTGDVKINSVCPGWVRTRMGGMNATRSVEEGAETVIWLATLPAQGPSGKFFRDKKPIEW